MQEALRSLTGDWCSSLIVAEEEPQVLQPRSDRVHLQYYHSPWLNVETYPATQEVDVNASVNDSLELAVDFPATNLLPDASLQPGETLLSRLRPQAPAELSHSETTTCSPQQR